MEKKKAASKKATSKKTVSKKATSAFSDIPLTPQSHFRILFYVAVYRVLYFLHSLEQSGGQSLEEFFEILTWRQLGLHAKPIFILNTDGYWDPLLHLLGQTVAEGFADATLLDFASVATDTKDLEAGLKEAFS